MTIRPAKAADLDAWATLRAALWPDGDVAEHREEAEAMLAAPGQAAFVATAADGSVAGFAEAAIRHDYVNGCDTSPVGFLEGIYVAPELRHRGFARALCAAVETWAAAQGCTEFASDALIDNGASHAMHRALGFAETERVVYFRKLLSGSD